MHRITQQEPAEQAPIATTSIGVERSTWNIDSMSRALQKALDRRVTQGLNLLSIHEFESVSSHVQSEMTIWYKDNLQPFHGTNSTSTQEDVTLWHEQDLAYCASAWGRCLDALVDSRRYHVLAITNAGTLRQYTPTKKEALRVMRAAMNGRPNVYGSITPHSASSLALRFKGTLGGCPVFEFVTDDRGVIDAL